MSNKKIIYQGIKGSHSWLAGVKFFGGNNKFIEANNFKEIFLKVDKNKADYGVIPIENSLIGSIYENYDLLKQFKLKVVGEIYLKIEHNLLGIKFNHLKGEKRIKLIKKIYSHPKALEQCSKFFERYNWLEKVAFSDTAGAAKYVAEAKDLTLGAIASKIAAKIYKLEIIKEKIEDDKNNYTRFWIITKKYFLKKPSKKDNKGSIIFTLKHQPGSLYNALKVFAENKINLTKIESRPIIGKPFEYLFFVDFEFDKNDKILKILEELKKKTIFLEILGFYEKGKFF
jgi:chorismate mutase/prephenate dehydratase